MFIRRKSYSGLFTTQDENRRGYQRSHENLKQGTVIQRLRQGAIAGVGVETSTNTVFTG